MSTGINRAQLLGNIGQDPELRYTQSGQAVLNMRLATSERYKAPDGEWKERTDWHSVVVWGKRGEALSKILTKGSMVFIEGSIRHSSFEGRDGQKRNRTEINAREVIIVGGGDAGRQEQHREQPPQQRPQQWQQQRPPERHRQPHTIGPDAPGVEPHSAPQPNGDTFDSGDIPF